MDTMRYSIVIFDYDAMYRAITITDACPSVCPSTKSFFDFTEIWYVGRGQWVMHDGMQYNSIQG